MAPIKTFVVIEEKTEESKVREPGKEQLRSTPEITLSEKIQIKNTKPSQIKKRDANEHQKLTP